MSAPPSFPKSDPAGPQFWDDRFNAAFTPWDQGGVPASLREYMELESGAPPQRVLIPGCGSGHEVAYFVQRGVTPLAIDFASAAVARARALLGPLASHVREADFFDPAIQTENIDAIYERAFLCALPRRLWPAWATQVAALLPRGGRLFGFFFTDDSERGPPFGLKPGELEALLKDSFTREAITQPTDSIPVFAGKETWQVWRRC
jgi:SAM-dependent methyltransferase